MWKTVFISHIAEEKELAFFIKGFIEEAFLGLIEVFVSCDRDSENLGQKWLSSIRSSLKLCCLEIVLCSQKSIQNPWINFEAGAGWIRGIPVIPICHSGAEPSTLPVPLRLLPAAQANEKSSMILLLPVLAEAIGSKVPVYDFTDFVSRIKIFESQYLFWDDCNRIFSEIHAFNAQIVPTLKKGETFHIALQESEIRFFADRLPFLKSHVLIDLQKTGGVKMTNSGTFYDFDIVCLPRLRQTLIDPNFRV